MLRKYRIFAANYGAVFTHFVFIMTVSAKDDAHAMRIARQKGQPCPVLEAA